MIKDLTALFWDFDGVILDSNRIRKRGFNLVLKDYPAKEVKKLLEFHKKNGGLSRYVKFRYFFETIRNEPKSDEQIQLWADKFSEIMKKELTDRKLLIYDSINYIEFNHRKIPMYIVSGSDQSELRYLCKKLGIANYFQAIYGSPIPKNMLIKNIIEKHRYNPGKCLLIGDSINDLEAARINNVNFAGYNNKDLKGKSESYIKNFTTSKTL